METIISKINPNKPADKAINKASDIIDKGGLVGFPTETVYGIACRVKGESLQKLSEIKGRPAEKYYTLHIAEKKDVKRYVPKLDLRTQRLIRAAWPGPLTIVFDLSEKQLLQQQNLLEKEVFENLYKDFSIGVRCPDNPIATMLLKTVNNAVVAPSANITGRKPAVDAQEVMSQFSGEIDMLLDGGPCKYKTSSTVVKTGKDRIEVIRKGVYSQKQLEDFCRVKFLFVCTGNTCRSPMAEGMFKKYLAEKLECSVDQLEQKGYKTYSAGTLGITGAPASSESVTACAAKGIDITKHRSAALSEQLVQESDLVYVMSRMHRDFIVSLSPEAAERCLLLAEDRDIADPIGQQQQVYNGCADVIEEAVKKRISELEI